MELKYEYIVIVDMGSETLSPLRGQIEVPTDWVMEFALEALAEQGEACRPPMHPIHNDGIPITVRTIHTLHVRKPIGGIREHALQHRTIGLSLDEYPIVTRSGSP
jgi:hypothetical protein